MPNKFEEYAKERGYKIIHPQPQPWDANPIPVLSKVVGDKVYGWEITEQMMEWSDPDCWPTIFNLYDAEITLKASDA